MGPFEGARICGDGFCSAHCRSHVACSCLCQGLHVRHAHIHTQHCTAVVPCSIAKHHSCAPLLAAPFQVCIQGPHPQPGACGRAPTHIRSPQSPRGPHSLHSPPPLSPASHATGPELEGGGAAAHAAHAAHPGSKGACPIWEGGLCHTDKPHPRLVRSPDQTSTGRWMKLKRRMQLMD